MRSQEAPGGGGRDGAAAARVSRALHTLGKVIVSAAAAPQESARAVPEQEESKRRELLARALVQEVVQARGSLDQLIPPTGAPLIRVHCFLFTLHCVYWIPRVFPISSH